MSGSDKKRRWLPLERLRGFRARAGLCCGCRHLGVLGKQMALASLSIFIFGILWIENMEC